MAHRLRFHSGIPDDLIAALDHYDKISPDLGDRFRQSVDRRLDEIEEQPERFAADVFPIRFAKIERFSLSDFLCGEV